LGEECWVLGARCGVRGMRHTRWVVGLRAKECRVWDLGFRV